MYESICDATVTAQSPAFAENPSCSAQPEGSSAGRTYLMAMALMVRKWGETTVYLHHLLIMAATGNSEAYVDQASFAVSLFLLPACGLIIVLQSLSRKRWHRGN